MPENLESFAKISNMVDSLSTLYQDVIYIDFHGFADFISEHLGYQPLICGSSIFQSKGHDPIAVQAQCGDEGSILLVWAE